MQFINLIKRDREKGNFAKLAMFCLVFTGLLVLCGHLLQEGLIAQSRKLTSYAVKLTEANSKVLLTLDHCTELAATKDAAKARFLQAEIDRNQQTLQGINGSRFLLSDDDRQTQNASSNNVALTYQDWSDAVNTFQRDIARPTVVPAAIKLELQRVNDSAIGYCLALEAADYRVLESLQTKLEQSQLLNIGVGVAILVSLAMFYFAAFKPQLRQIQVANERLASASAALSGSNTALEQQHKQISERNLELELRQGDLSSMTHELEQLQKLHAQAARRFEELFQRVPVACFSYDKEGIIHEWNVNATKIFALNPYEALDRSAIEVFGQEENGESFASFLKASLQGETMEEVVWKYVNAAGELRWIQSNSIPLVSDSGDLLGALCASIDFTERFEYEARIEANMRRINEYSIELEKQKNELQTANLRLESLATTDGLTGLRNHRNFQERLEQNVQQAKGERLELSLMLLDVDHFKKFNDSYGHQAGDNVLRGVAAVLKAYGNDPYTVARYGGEEFVVVVPDCGEKRALELAEEIRQKIEDACPTGRTVTTSIGISVWHSGMRSRAELIAQADKALYASKEAGRNRCTLASKTWDEDAA